MATASATQPAFSPEFAATFRDLLVAALRDESKTTARVLSAIPEARRDYRPDPKSRTAFELAWHLASTEVWFLEGIADLSFEKMYDNEKNEAKLRPTNVGGLVKWYDTNFNAALNRIRGMNPKQLTTVLNFFEVFNLPAFHYLLFTKSHTIHHRGQLAAYLRPMGSKVPNIYGGSADEPMNL
ncbi:MAG TPA: DinB family protein [Terriglobales bacterium]|nr:DinB family protein [Terriglobales bacterium]